MHRLGVWVMVIALFAVVTAGQATPSFEGERAFGHIEALCELGARVPGSPAHEAGLRYILAAVDLPGARVQTQSFSGRRPDRGEPVEMANIRARFGPEGAALAIGSHWDCRYVSNLEPDSTRRGEPVPGANDGASGVAVMLELARLLSATPPPRPVELLFFDGEDQGTDEHPELWIQGSQYYASQMGDDRPSGLILIDMIGDRDLEIPREGYSDEHAAGLVDAVWDAAARLGVHEFADYVGEHIIDDHVPFLQAGVDAVCVIDYQYSKWHTRSDLPEMCSAESLDKVGRVLVDFIYGP